MLQFFFPVVLCSVDGALTESGNCSDVWNVRYRSAHYTPESRRGTRTSIRQNSLLPSFPARSELIVLHHASALAQESATHVLKWKDLGPLRLPCPSSVKSSAAFGAKHACTSYGKDLATWDRRADGDLRRLGGLARDERSDNSC